MRSLGSFGPLKLLLMKVLWRSGAILGPCSQNGQFDKVRFQVGSYHLSVITRGRRHDQAFSASAIPALGNTTSYIRKVMHMKIPIMR